MKLFGSPFIPLQRRLTTWSTRYGPEATCRAALDELPREGPGRDRVTQREYRVSIMVVSRFGATHRWPRNRWRWIASATTLTVTAVALVVAAGSRAGAAATASSRPTVTCDKSGGIVLPAGDRNGYRVLLGVVSVPADYIPGVVPTRGRFFRPWRFWSKAGLNVRAGSPAVVVSVPRAWRNRAAITWGNGTGTVSALRLASCPTSVGAWIGYPGGFLLQTPSACVPLVFRVGQQTATIRFGLGRRCSGN